MDGFAETNFWEYRNRLSFHRFRGIGLHILISLEKYSVFCALLLFMFAAKKQIKYSKIRTAETSGI